MKISPAWLRDFVDLPVAYLRLADELTLAGVAVEAISDEGQLSPGGRDPNQNECQEHDGGWRSGGRQVDFRGALARAGG